MDDREWVERFQHDIDPQPTPGPQPDKQQLPASYRQLLEVAARLGQADFSSHSHIRSSLRARLLKTEASSKAGHYSPRRSLPLAIRYVAAAALLLLLAIGLSWAIEKFVPRNISGSSPLVTTGPIIVLDDYIGIPRPMVLEINGQTQAAAIGSYCWAKERQGQSLRQECADTIGLPTPRDPLRISSPVSARLRSPYPMTASQLSLVIMPIGADTKAYDQSNSEFFWKFTMGQVVYVPLQPEPVFQLVLSDGLYAFNLQASFPELGTVTYGFLVLVENSQPTATVPIAPTVEPPTAAPTEAPPAGETAVPAGPEGFYATQQAQRETQIAARATASPFPTALPVDVTPGSPASASATRGGLTLEVRLSKDQFVAGEGGQAQVTLRNDGPEPLFIGGDGRHLASVNLLDDQGIAPDPWPFSWLWLMSGPPYQLKLEPGQQQSETLQFQVPPLDNNPATTYALWAETRFSRADPIQPEGADNVWLRLESGPINLKVTSPGPANRLRVDLQADRTGWELKVTGPDGKAPAGLMWGEIGASSSGATGAGPLHLSPDGTASGSWEESLFGGDAQMVTGGWVAAEGYVTAPFSQTIPGTQSSGLPIPSMGMNAILRQTYTTLAAAQASLGFPIAQMDQPPLGAFLTSVQVEWPGTGVVNILQKFQLADGRWLVLEQYATTYDDNNYGWGQARWDMEAQKVAVNGAEAYAIQHNGWLRLDWKTGKTGFELSVPAQSLSLEDLIQLAGDVTGKK